MVINDKLEFSHRMFVLAIVVEVHIGRLIYRQQCPYVPPPRRTLPTSHFKNVVWPRYTVGMSRHDVTDA